MEKTIEYSDEMDVREVFRLVEEGYELTCHRCKVKLNISRTPEEAKEKRIPRGITCPTNPKHISIILNFDRKNFWKELEDKWEKDRSSQ